MKFAREVPSEKWCREALLLADDPLLDPHKRDAGLERMEEKLVALLQESLAVATRTEAMRPKDLARVITRVGSSYGNTLRRGPFRQQAAEP